MFFVADVLFEARVGAALASCSGTVSSATMVARSSASTEREMDKPMASLAPVLGARTAPYPVKEPKKKPDPLEVVVVADGRLCKVCGAKDSDPDPCFKRRTLLWGYPPEEKANKNEVGTVVVIWVNCGKVCFYCYKVIRSNYMPKYTTKGVCELVGKDSEEMKRFMGLRAFCVESIKTSGDPTAYITWTAKKQELNHLMDSATVWQMPQDLYIPLADYMKDKGDPATNGLGHQKAKNLHGADCVIVPESTIMTRRKEIRDTVRLQTRLDDTESEMQAGQMQAKWKQLQGTCLMDGTGVDAAVTSPTTVGASMVDMLGLGFLAGPGMAVGRGHNSPSGDADGAASSSGRKKAPVADVGADNFLDDFAGMAMFDLPSSSTPLRGERKPEPEQAEQSGRSRRSTTALLGRRTAGADQEPPPKKAKVGRPSRDLASLVRSMVSSWEKCPADPQNPDHRLFFGDQHAHQTKTIAKLKKDHESWLASVDEDDELDNHLLDRKKLAAIADIFAAYKKSQGQFCTAFTKALEVTEQFLAAPPPASLEMPAPVRQLAFEGQVQAASPEEFWELVTTAQLEKAGFSEPVPQQQEKASDAVAALAQGDSLETVTKGMALLCGRLLETEVRDQVHGSTVLEIDAVAELVRFFMCAIKCSVRPLILYAGCVAVLLAHFHFL